MRQEHRGSRYAVRYKFTLDSHGLLQYEPDVTIKSLCRETGTFYVDVIDLKVNRHYRVIARA